MVQKVPGVVVKPLGKFVGNELMGSKTLFYPTSRLAKQLPNVGSRMLERHRFGGSGGDLPFQVAGGPDYDLFIEVRRVS